MPGLVHSMIVVWAVVGVVSGVAAIAAAVIVVGGVAAGVVAAILPTLGLSAVPIIDIMSAWISEQGQDRSTTDTMTALTSS